MMNEKFDIEVAAFSDSGSFLCGTDGAITLTKVNRGKMLILSTHMIELISECINELTPEEDQRTHLIRLKYVYEIGSHLEPSQEYFTVTEMSIEKFYCAVCKKEISEDDFFQASTCSLYCSEVLNGVPVPFSQSAMIFDKWHNK